jgi:DNA-binding MurR/RpiR family transcriptional regulator
MYQQRVRELYSQLSPAYRRIADFLLEHYREAAFMTAAQIGQATQADTTAVVRFAQRLGYPGFPELLTEVQEEVKRDLRQIYEPAQSDRSPRATFQRCLIEDRHNLDYMLLHNDLTEVDAVITLLGSAHRIFVAGESTMSYLAELFTFRLTALGLNAWPLANDLLGRLAFAVNLVPEDVVFAIGPTAGSAGLAVLLKIARERGCHTVAVVGAPNNRAAFVAEHILFAPARTVGLFYSPASILTILHALVQALSANLPEFSANWALRAEHLIRQYRAGLRAEPEVTVRDTLVEQSAPGWGEETDGL